MKVIKINENNNVAVAVSAVNPGEEVTNGVTAAEKIPAGHKIALTDIPAGSPVIKYGYPIGTAAKDIKRETGYTPTTLKPLFRELSSTNIIP